MQTTVSQGFLQDMEVCRLLSVRGFCKTRRYADYCQGFVQDVESMQTTVSQGFLQDVESMQSTVSQGFLQDVESMQTTVSQGFVQDVEGMQTTVSQGFLPTASQGVSVRCEE